MTDVVGLPVSLAKQRLMAEGYRVTCVEARSRKGSGGTDERVIRASLSPEGDVVLTTALFVSLKTDDSPA